MAAQRLSRAGVEVHVFDAMPTAGRKFLLAGKGGLNLTHSEDADRFASRYGTRRAAVEPLLHALDAKALRAWAQSLGIETFTGTSGRVFPVDLKAAPLLRAWLHQLRHPTAGVPVQFHMRHRWRGWSSDGRALRFESGTGQVEVCARVVVLALGGGSWKRLGSDGLWVPLLQDRGVALAPLLPSNCGFDVSGGWSPFFSAKFAGKPFKSVAIHVAKSTGQTFSRKGEFVATASGVEGSLIYAASSLLRDEISSTGKAELLLDLLPDISFDKVFAEVMHPRGSRSLATHLKSRLHLDGIKAAILYELPDAAALRDPKQLALRIKALPISLQSARPLDEAISSAGGILFEALNGDLMLEQLPGTFCSGEMLDWEAPTGGYLLQACFASGHVAGEGALRYLMR